jgi:chromosome partitioning protein
MTERPLIVGFVSQKGGTGKSTLARALGALVAHAGLKVRVADLDPAQGTVIEWEKIRKDSRTSPPLSVEPFDEAAEAIGSAAEDELLIIDAPAHASRGTLEIAQAATLVVQPTAGTIDDLRPAVLLFHELAGAGIPKEHLVFALCRLLSETEERQARDYLKKAGYDVLPGFVPERSAYRDAHNRGHAITEGRKTLDARLEALMEGLYSRIAALSSRKSKTTRKKDVS